MQNLYQKYFIGAIMQNLILTNNRPAQWKANDQSHKHKRTKNIKFCVIIDLGCITQ